MTAKITNVGIVSYDYFPPIGGQGIYVNEIKNNLNLNKVKPVVISTSKKNSEDIEIKSKNNFIFSIKFNLKIKKLIKKNNINVLHIQGGPGGVFLLRKLEIPVIYTAHHNYWSKYQLTSNKISKLLFYLEKRGYHLCNKIISPSNSLKNTLLNEYNITPDKIITISEGFNPDVFYKISQKKIKYSVVFVGRLHKIKAVDRLIYSIDKLNNNYSEISLYIIGEGDEKNNLVSLAKSLNLENRIHFLGSLDQDEINKWYNKCEVLVLPSFFEGFGLVVLEAAATSLPSIASQSCGVSEIIKKENIGIVIKDNEINSIVDAINLVFKKKISSINTSSLKKNYSWKSITSKTEEVLLA